jgi:hypothetical protein
LLNGLTISKLSKGNLLIIFSIEVSLTIVEEFDTTKVNSVKFGHALNNLNKPDEVNLLPDVNAYDCIKENDFNFGNIDIFDESPLEEEEEEECEDRIMLSLLCALGISSSYPSGAVIESNKGLSSRSQFFIVNFCSV